MGKKTRSKAKKKLIKHFRDVGMEDPNKHRCLICEYIVSNHEGPLEIHYMGKMHRHLEKLELHTSFFLEQGLIHTSSVKMFECTWCERVGSLADVQKLKSHLLNVHFMSAHKQYLNLFLDLWIWSRRDESLWVI